MGARVVLLDLSVVESPAKSAAAFLSIACDVRDEASVVAACEEVERTWGGCEVLVNNAAILPPSMPFANLAVETRGEVMAVNVRGAFLCSKHFSRSMRAWTCALDCVSFQFLWIDGFFRFEGERK